MSTGFALDPRLAADTLPVTQLALCEVRLMNDARYRWLILVPRRPQLVETTDLDDEAQCRLWREVTAAGAALRSNGPCDKLNIGALGNIVRQLHVHVVARQATDAAWPGPVWGDGAAQPYAPARATALVATLAQALR